MARNKIEKSRLNEVIRLLKRCDKNYDRDIYALALKEAYESSLDWKGTAFVSCIESTNRLRGSFITASELETLLELMSVEVIDDEED